MSIYDSRAVTPDKDLGDSALITKPSCSFKAPGRDTEANWSNRFRRDFNDLDYDIKYNLIKGKADMKPSFKHYQKKIRSSAKSNSKDKEKGISMDKYKNRF